jgi:hypothetical protein
MKSGPRRIAHAIADAMFEQESGGEGEARLLSLVDDVLTFAGAASWPSRVTLRVALLLLRFAPLLLFVSLRPLERLDRGRRREVLARVERSPLLLALVAWRTLLVLHYYEDAAALARIGYREERRRHLAVLPAPVESGVRLRDAAPSEDEIAVADEVADEKGAA